MRRKVTAGTGRGSNGLIMRRARGKLLEASVVRDVMSVCVP